MSTLGGSAERVVTDHPGDDDPDRMHENWSQPIRYRVVVRGRLGEHVARAFEELELDSHEGGSSLTGTFADLAQLHGLLDRLRNLGIQLVSVNPAD